LAPRYFMVSVMGYGSNKNNIHELQTRLNLHFFLGFYTISYLLHFIFAACILYALVETNAIRNWVSGILDILKIKTRQF
jgi:hypothetical protein